MTRPQVRRAARLVVIIGLAVAGCSAGPGTASQDSTGNGNTPTPSEPAATPSAECINPPRDLVTLINQTEPAACYGDTPITVEAEVVGIGAIDCAPIEPAWMGCSAWVGLQPIAGQAATTGIVLAATTGPRGPSQMFAAIHPETALEASDIIGRMLRVTGHYDDPAAQTCRQTEPVFDEATVPPPDISYCRNLFVLTAFEQL